VSFESRVDPNLEEVLRDVAAAPDSKLFPGIRLDRLQQSFGAPIEPVSNPDRSFSSAERELLFMHRRSLGAILEQAFVVSYLADKERAKWVRPMDHVPTSRELKRQAIIVRDMAPMTAFRHGAAEQISNLLDGTVSQSALGLRRLAASGLRVGGSSKARYYYALACEQTGDLQTAMQEARCVSASCDPSVALRGLSLVRRIQLLRKDREKADRTSAVAVERCFLYGEEKVLAIELANQVLSAIAKGDRRGLEELAGPVFDREQAVFGVLASSMGWLKWLIPSREWTRDSVHCILENPGGSSWAS
jgi:hypothetical protein